MVRPEGGRGPADPLSPPVGQAGAGHGHSGGHEIRGRSRLQGHAQHGRRFQPPAAVFAGAVGGHGPAGRSAGGRDDRIALRSRRRGGGLAVAAAPDEPGREFLRPLPAGPGEQGLQRRLPLLPHVHFEPARPRRRPQLRLFVPGRNPLAAEAARRGSAKRPSRSSTGSAAPRRSTATKRSRPCGSS